MTLEKLIEMGLNTDHAEKLAQMFARIQDSHDAELLRIKKDFAVEKALSGARAKNITAAKALLVDFLAEAELDGNSIKGLDDEIKKLSGGKNTAFLFGAEEPETLMIAGASPADVPAAEPDPKSLGYEARLADARKTGDSLAAIRIKREAAAQGVVLL